MVDLGKLFTHKDKRATKKNGVPAFERFSHRPTYINVVPDEIIVRICKSEIAHNAIDPILEEWEKANGDPKRCGNVSANLVGVLKVWTSHKEMSFPEYLQKYHSDLSVLTADENLLMLVLQKWQELKEDQDAFNAFMNEKTLDNKIADALKAWTLLKAMSFLEFLLQPPYHQHFSTLLGEEGMEALNKEIKLREYLHEVGVLCRLLKAYRIGSQREGSDRDVVVKVNKPGHELDSADIENLQKLYGPKLDITLYTISPDGKTVVWVSKGHPLIVQFLLWCNDIMPPLTKEQMQELLQERIKGFWALFCNFDLIPHLIKLDKSEEEAKAILSRAQDGTLGTEDMVALVKAFRAERVTIPAEQRILEKWLKALNSLIKQYLHITALINGHCTAKKEDLIAHSGINGNALAFLEYVLYHTHQGAMTQEGVSDLLHQMLGDALMLTSELNLKQGPMWKIQFENFKQRLAESKSETTLEQNKSYVPLIADLLNLIITQKPDHAVLKWFFEKIREVKDKHEMLMKGTRDRAVNGKNDEVVMLSHYETSLISIVKQIKSVTTNPYLLSILESLPLANLKKIIPTDEGVLKTVPSISIAEFEEMSGMLMALDEDALLIPYGDLKTSLDKDGCVGIFINPVNAKTYIVKTSSGIYAPRSLSTAITRGEDVSILFLMVGEDGKLVPVEIMNFYLNKEGEKVYVKEIKGKLVHDDGSQVPQGVEIEYVLIPAKSPQLLERYAILYLTGIMDEEFRKRLSEKPLVYTSNINIGKWRDLIHYIIRWITDTLTELSVLLHMLRTINAPQSLIARIEALKALRDRLFQTMPQTGAISQEFMQEWVSMIQEAFAIGLHTPDVLAFMQRNGDINGLTEEQTEKIQGYLKTMYMNRLSFFKAIVFRLCQIMYGLFVCIPENQHMIYIKAELAEKVLPVLHEKRIDIKFETLMALLHRNYSLPSDIRLTSSLHLDFEKFVLGALAVLFPHFTGQELHQRVIGEPVSWLSVVPTPEPEPALAPEAPAPAPKAHTSEAPAPAPEAPAPAPKAHTSEAPALAPEAPAPASKAHTAETTAHATATEPEPVPESVPALEPVPVLEPTSAPELVQGASIQALTLIEINQFLKECKNGKGPTWLIIKELLATSYKKGPIGEMLMEIAKRDDPECNIIKAIVIVAKNVCKSTPSFRIEALIALALLNYFGHGQEAFVKYINEPANIPTGKMYNPTEDIKELPGRIAKLHESLQAPIPAPAQTHAQTHVCVSLWEKYRKVIYVMNKDFKRELDIMAVFDDKEKVVMLVENKDVFHVSPLPEGTLCVMSYTHPALSRELMSLMTHRLTTPNFQILGTVIPATSSVPLTMTKKRLSYQELHAEAVAHIAATGVSFLSILRFGSSLHHTDETRPIDRDVDFRVLIPEGERKGIIFIASDGTPCDLSFTTPTQAEKQHEVLIAMLLGSPWLDASGCIVEPFEMPKTLNLCLKVLFPVVGTTLHYNSLKGKDDPIKTFQSVRLMVALMKMVIEHQQYPHYDPCAFFPEGFNKDAFVQFLTSSKVDYVMVVDLFTKAQYCITKVGLKTQESKYQPTMDALPDSLKQLMLKFKEVTTTTFLNPGDKKGVSGVRSVLEYISKQ